MQDLEIPFSKHYYYCKAMEGKSSIKKVLPALGPGEPELDYFALEGVHKQILDYCCLDTLAVVKALERLYTILDGELDHVA